MLAGFGRPARGCHAAGQAGSWSNSGHHTALPSALFRKSGVAGSPSLNLAAGRASFPLSETPRRADFSYLRATHSRLGPALQHGASPAAAAALSRHFVVWRPTPDFCSPLHTDVPGLALGRPRPLRPAAELHEHFRQLVWLYAADPLSDEARPRPL